MAAPHHRASSVLERLLNEGSVEEYAYRLAPKSHAFARIPREPHITAETVEARWQALAAPGERRERLLDAQTRAQMEAYQRNIENFIGTVKLPVGIAGPLRVNGLHAQGDYVVPLATTEAALVASYSRGSQLITRAGGCTALLLNEGVSRAPGFAFRDLIEAGRFVSWVLSQMDAFRAAAATTTRHGRLLDLRVTVEGNHVYLGFDYATGDAAGQNMVTIATEAVCRYILEHTPVEPQYSFVEANLSGDKKASALSFLSVRGKKVTAEVHLPAELVKAGLHTTPEQMVNYWRMSAMGGVLSGTVGVQGHYANGLAALYIACGQDAACVAESAVGVTRFELTGDGDLYAAVTLPNLIVGTVGGGTGLPSQRACLELLGLAGPGHAQALAEICAALALAGELSIIGALAAGHFARAHQQLARGSGKDA
ncbi:3-hydroxy-3-methylglutaryl CoA reductase [Sulfurifustis variabilis]|uniref:hydroxymethylglutaryl-CoA reductase (NADPH) n=1 Tax=Sulfurifustis variabilis TaxID=1675686 RepID=A0A1B4VBY9_9GAMM|nr:hydroxymethylglutaryl-CoA reductase [Sulfurifustis variabilis]BAU50284.1 3-hydroxy-3-methylglutaryl CoA reductase [Sulfurifustis variabilis]